MLIRQSSAKKRVKISSRKISGNFENFGFLQNECFERKFPFSPKMGWWPKVTKIYKFEKCVTFWPMSEWPKNDQKLVITRERPRKTREIGVKSTFSSVNTRKSALLHQNLRLKTSIFHRKIEKNKVFKCVSPKITPIFPVFTELNLDFTEFPGVAAWPRLGPPL